MKLSSCFPLNFCYWCIYHELFSGNEPNYIEGIYDTNNEVVSFVHRDCEWNNINQISYGIDIYNARNDNEFIMIVTILTIIMMK